MSVTIAVDKCVLREYTLPVPLANYGRKDEWYVYIESKVRKRVRLGAFKSYFAAKLAGYKVSLIWCYWLNEKNVEFWVDNQ